MASFDLFEQLLPRVYNADLALVKDYLSLIEFGESKKILHKTHSHHVFPKSVAKSLRVPRIVWDDSSNRVNLSIENHIRAHYYLAKIFGGNMVLAFFLFTDSPEALTQDLETLGFLIKAKAELLEEAARQRSLNQKGKHLSKSHCENIAKGKMGVPRSEESKRHQSETRKKNHMGLSPESAKKVSMKLKGRKNSEKAIENIRKGANARFLREKENGIVRKWSEDQRHKITEQTLDRIVLTDGTKRRYLKPGDPRIQTLLEIGWRLCPKWERKQDKDFRVDYVCPWCGVKGRMPGIHTWHFDHCKKNPDYTPIKEHDFHESNKRAWVARKRNEKMAVP